ncbi:unnamed protein product, partial [Prorocentrum cordatum]
MAVTLESMGALLDTKFEANLAPISAQLTKLEGRPVPATPPSQEAVQAMVQEAGGCRKDISRADYRNLIVNAQNKGRRDSTRPGAPVPLATTGVQGGWDQTAQRYLEEAVRKGPTPRGKWKRRGPSDSSEDDHEQTEKQERKEALTAALARATAAEAKVESLTRRLKELEGVDEGIRAYGWFPRQWNKGLLEENAKLRLFWESCQSPDCPQYSDDSDDECVQFCTFREEYCPSCKYYFIGNWKYKKNAGSGGRANFGKMTDITTVVTQTALPYVVVPREKAWHAVDLQLMQFITDDLHHSGGTFTSAIHAWAGKHPEQAQQNLILGEDMTQTCHTRVRLEDAWYLHNAIRLAGAGAGGIGWSFAPDGIESGLTSIAACVRQAHLTRVAEHVRTCPTCVGKLVVLLDGKHGARRLICGGLEGYGPMQGLELELCTGCQRNAPTKQFFCKWCRPSTIEQAHVIPQEKILGIAAPGSASSGDSALRYVVRCHDPDLPERPFEAHLPRAEVHKELLAEFEKSLLRNRGDHGNKKTRPAWIKGARQLSRWLTKQSSACGPPSSAGASRGADAQRGGKKAQRGPAAKVRAPTTGGAASKRGKAAGTSRRVKRAGVGRGPAATAPRQSARAKSTKRPAAADVSSDASKFRSLSSRCRGWLALDDKQEESIQARGVDKLHGSNRVRRCTGGVVTAVTSCGLLADWMELFRGESIELVYAFALRLHKAPASTEQDARELGFVIAALGYDNACKLLSLQGRGADACQQAPALTKGEIRTVYRILESHNPFPEQAVRRATPLTWAVASALGQATSLHASCVCVHLMILVATTLGAVQIKYGGILSRHCKLLMLQHGQPGDGKSVALWLDVQVLAFFDMIRERRAKKKHDEACQKHKDDPENHPEPAKKEHVKDTIFNMGTFIGLGNFMQAQGETAFLALHEGKTWLPQTFDNGPGGGIDDLNQIHDHDMYKNHPGNTQNRFLVRNPHLCGAVMMHIEELYDQAQKPDTTAGMMRFLIGHFPAVVNKIRPDVPPSQITRLLQDDPDYFNDLDYDDVVTAIGKIMLVASALYVRGVERADEKDNNRYSRVRGTHFLPWKPDVK